MIKSPLVRKIVATEIYEMEEIFSMKGRIYTFVNPVSYLIALKNKELFAPFDGLFADGSILVAAVTLVYHHRVTRRSFDMTSLAPMLFNYANSRKKSVCVVATKQQVMERSVAKLANEHPDIVWKGCRNGYFASDDEMREAAEKIAQENPDFLIVGMGAMMQEKFLLMCREAGYRGIGFTCGGFIHQYAENKHDAYYPNWADRMNLRFLYRMYKEPHTRKRYAVAAFEFPVRFIYERLFGNENAN